MIDLTSPKELNAELEKAILSNTALHDKMRQQKQFYKNSAFFDRQANQASNYTDFRQNLLQVFADKNIEYTSPLPKVKVPTPGADEMQREFASAREKLIHSVRRDSNMALLQTEWAEDATLCGMAIAETVIDIEKRCVRIVRHNPMKCYFTFGDDGGDRRILTFWAVWTITADEAKQRYGVTPTKDSISPLARKDVSAVLDGHSRFTEAIRWDGNTRTHWIGDVIVEEPHATLLGELPIDICTPIRSIDSETNMPGFFLDPLIAPQAELNDVFYRRGRIVRRMSSPVAWVRGVGQGKLDDAREQMSKPGGGLISLTQNGEAGLLQLGETRMLNDHEDRIILAMTRIAGYGNAAFGESVGANTSGDALGMYFNATQRKIERQWVHWVAFHEAIYAKALRAYERMLKTGEQIPISGYAPAGTLRTTTDDKGQTQYLPAQGMYQETIDRTVISQNYITVVIPPTATPHNVLDSKRLAIEAVKSGFLSRTTAYEEFGILSPQDELKLIEQEMLNPALNSEGIASVLSAANGLNAAPPTAPNV